MKLSTVALVAAPLFSSAAAPWSAADPPPVRWFDGSFEHALAAARGRGRLLVIEFRRPWCPFGQRLEQETLADEAVARALRGFVCLSVDPETEGGARLAARFDVHHSPSLAFVDGRGRQQDRVAGFLPPAELLAELRRIATGIGTVDRLESDVAANPCDLEARYALAKKLESLGDRAGAAEHMRYLRRADPAGRSRPMREVRLAGMIENVERDYAGSGRLRLARVHSFLAEERDPDVRARGWAAVGALQERLAESMLDPLRQGELRTAARAAFHEASRRPTPELAGRGRPLAFDLLAGARARRAP